MSSTPDTAVVVVTSHRARWSLRRLLADDPRYVPGGNYNADRLFADPNDYHVVPADRLADVLQIKGVRERKRPVRLARRWTA